MKEQYDAVSKDSTCNDYKKFMVRSWSWTNLLKVIALPALEKVKEEVTKAILKALHWGEGNSTEPLTINLCLINTILNPY